MDAFFLLLTTSKIMCREILYLGLVLNVYGFCKYFSISSTLYDINCAEQKFHLLKFEPSDRIYLIIQEEISRLVLYKHYNLFIPIFLKDIIVKNHSKR